MALKIKNTNYYLKLNLDGTFILYESPTDRLSEKTAPTPEQISAKYRKILAKLSQNEERCYYDPTYCSLLDSWEAEYSRYLRAARQQSKETNFPLMAEYFNNIEDSLPQVHETGRIAVRGETLTEFYNWVKDSKVFGEVEDC
jgi:hypothetical protein